MPDADNGEIQMNVGGMQQITITGPSNQWDGRDLYTMATVALIQEAATSFWEKADSFYAAVLSAVARHYVYAIGISDAFGGRTYEVLGDLMGELTRRKKLLPIIRSSDGDGVEGLNKD